MTEIEKIHHVAMNPLDCNINHEDGDTLTVTRVKALAYLVRGGDSDKEPDGLTTKQAWWAGYRAGKGLPADTPRRAALATEAQPPSDTPPKHEYDAVVQIGEDRVQFSTVLVHADIYKGVHRLQLKIEQDNLNSYRDAMMGKHETLSADTVTLGREEINKRLLRIHEKVTYGMAAEERKHFVVLGHSGEAGELANVVKKEWRGDDIPLGVIAGEIADFCFESKDHPKYGASWLAVVQSLTASDGINPTLEPFAIPADSKAVLREVCMKVAEKVCAEAGALAINTRLQKDAGTARYELNKRLEAIVNSVLEGKS